MTLARHGTDGAIKSAALAFLEYDKNGDGVIDVSETKQLVS